MVRLNYQPIFFTKNADCLLRPNFAVPRKRNMFWGKENSCFSFCILHACLLKDKTVSLFGFLHIFHEQVNLTGCCNWNLANPVKEAFR